MDLTRMTVLVLWCWNRSLDLLELQQVGSYMKIKLRARSIFQDVDRFHVFESFLDSWAKLCP